MSQIAPASSSLANLISNTPNCTFVDDAQHEALTDQGTLVVNHFEFLRELGRGAFAVVVLAQHQTSSRLVVQKLLICIFKE